MNYYSFFLYILLQGEKLIFFYFFYKKKGLNLKKFCYRFYYVINILFILLLCILKNIFGLN